MSMVVLHSTGNRTHWVARWKMGKNVFYFDSYGLAPPFEFESYMKGNKIVFNKDQVQPEETVVCGHFCIFFLVEMSKRKTLSKIVKEFL